VTIFQLVRDHTEVIRQPQDLHVVLAAGELAGGQRVLQQCSGFRQLTQPAAQKSQDPGGLEHRRIVLAQLVARLLKGFGQAGGGRAGIGSGGRLRGRSREAVT
jgi:hypothetical protein